jgi:predicted nucleic acid-binding protein
MRLFLDANIIFSAAISPKGRCQAFFDFSKEKFCSLLTSPHALTETKRNLLTKYPAQIERFNTQLFSQLIIVQEAPPAKIDWAVSLGLPLKDAPILATAVDSGANLLVTGDKQHFSFLYGRIIEGMEITDPATAIARLLDKL